MAIQDFRNFQQPQTQFRPTAAGAVNITNLPTTNQTPVQQPFGNTQVQPISNQVANTIQQNIAPFNPGPTLPPQLGPNLPPQLVTGAARDFSQFGDMRAQTAIRELTNELGLGGAVDIVNGVLVDSNGNPIQGAMSGAEFTQLLDQRLNPAQLNVIDSNPGGTTLSPDGVNLQLQAPTTGIIGSEQALGGALTGSLDAVAAGAAQGRTDLITGQQGAQQQLDEARDRNAQSSLDVFGIATDQIDERFGVSGAAANQQQAALSGALGAEAQREAFANFTDSPGQKFFVDKQMQTLLDNARATGGLGGGRVLEALQREAAGNAAQFFQQNFQNLGEVAGRGLTADQVRAGLAGQIGNQFLGQQGKIDLTGADLTSGTGTRLADQAIQTGFGAANLISGTGTQVAAGRLDTGKQIADAISTTTSGLAGLTETQGARIAEIIGTGGGNLVNIISGVAKDLGMSAEALATGLSNLAAQQGTSVSKMISGAALIPQGSSFETTANLISAVGSLASQINKSNES